ALESSGSWITPLHPTLCIALGDIRFGCSFLVMETHSMKLSMHCCCANLKHVLTSLCHFTRPTTLWLSCCCSQLLPLCYNTTNS
ncbi:unnamed protein product, partial [Staurois parvus]